MRGARRPPPRLPADRGSAHDREGATTITTWCVKRTLDRVDQEAVASQAAATATQVPGRGEGGHGVAGGAPPKASFGADPGVANTSNFSSERLWLPVLAEMRGRSPRGRPGRRVAGEGQQDDAAATSMAAAPVRACRRCRKKASTRGRQQRNRGDERDRAELGLYPLSPSAAPARATSDRRRGGAGPRPPRATADLNPQTGRFGRVAPTDYGGQPKVERIDGQQQRRQGRPPRVCPPHDRPMKYAATMPTRESANTGKRAADDATTEEVEGSSSPPGRVGAGICGPRRTSRWPWRKAEDRQ